VIQLIGILLGVSDSLCDAPILQAKLALLGIPPIPNRNTQRQQGNFFGLYSLNLTMMRKNRYSPHRIHSVEE